MNRILQNLIIVFLLLGTLPLCAKEYRVQDVPNVQVADARQYVTDPDNVLGEEAQATINLLLAQLRDSNSVEAVVVVLPSIGNEDIDNFATELFMDWGVGKAANDNGLMFLAVMDQRQIVIRTGYGIEGVLPDVLCSRIIRQYITPAFRAGEYGRGMIEAVQQALYIIMTPEASAELLAEEQGSPLFAEIDKQALLNILYGYLILGAIISLLVTIRLNRTIRNLKDQPYECYKEIENAHALTLILAIFFPIWGAVNLTYSNRTKRRMREQPRKCDECGTMMHRLSETEDNYFLTPQENAEEFIGSVDYDVWMCDNCRNTEIFRFENKYTKYQECPHCHAKTYSLKHDHIVHPPTSLVAGRGEKVYVCSYCKTRKVIPYVIPIVVASSGSGGGSMGGGNFGGGFGGGMTGGGGARGGW